MIKRLLMFVSVVVALGVGWGVFLVWQQYDEQKRFSLPVGHAASLVKDYAPAWVVAPGFVEPVTKELRLGFDMSGVIGALLVKEGDTVVIGQPLASLRQEEYLAKLEDARARLALATADMDMHTAGARIEERAKAESELQRAEAREEQARKELARREVMIKSRSIGIEELERAERDADITKYELAIAQHQDRLIKKFFRDEEVEMARQRLESAKAAVAEAEALLDKTMLRSPISGTVLRIFSDPGEAYSIFEPAPILSVGDISTLNVRAEVDERDVARVNVGQAAFVSADTFGGTRHLGTVTRRELSMTPKKTRTGDPSEPVDRSVLEVLVTLDEPGPFISGMRVDVYIQGTPPLLEPMSATAPEQPAASPAPSPGDTDAGTSDKPASQ